MWQEDLEWMLLVRSCSQLTGNELSVYDKFNRSTVHKILDSPRRVVVPKLRGLAIPNLLKDALPLKNLQ